MLPLFLEEKCAYEFSQSLDSVYRETDKAPPVASKAIQQGFLQVDSKKKGAGVVRMLSQFLLSKATMAQLRTVKSAEIGPLFDEHLKNYRALPHHFGLELPVEFATDALNGGAAPPYPTFPGKPKPAVPFEGVHFPFIMPALSADEPTVGHTWKSMIAINVAQTPYDLPYNVTWVDRNLVSVSAKVTFEAANPEKPVTRNGISLVFRAAGSYTITYSLLLGCPTAASGNLQFLLLATLPPATGVTEVINTKLAFQWKKIPLGYTDKIILPEAWAKMPAAPAA